MARTGKEIIPSLAEEEGAPCFFLLNGVSKLLHDYRRWVNDKKYCGIPQRTCYNTTSN